MTGKKVFELRDLVEQLDKGDSYFLDFLKVRDLEAGIIVLHPGEKDTQDPHSADELYYVIEGSGFIEIGKDRHPIKKGSIIFVPARMHHRFIGNKEDIIVIYVFAG